MNMPRLRKVIILLVISIATGVLAEFLQIKTQPSFVTREYKLAESAACLYPQENDIGLNNVEFQNGIYHPTGPDPYMVIDTAGLSHISSVMITFSEPVAVAQRYQLFYADEPGAFSEAKSVWVNLNVGQMTSAVDIPGNAYAHLRIDIDGEVLIDKIECSDQNSLIASEHIQKEGLHWKRAALVAVFAFVLLMIADLLDWSGGFAGRIHALYTEAVAHKRKTICSILAFLACALVVSLLSIVILKINGYPLNKPIVVFCLAAGSCFSLMLICRKTLCSKAEYIFLYIALTAGFLLVFGMQFNTRNSWDEEYHFRSVLNVSYISEMRFTEADNALLTNMMVQAAPVREIEQIEAVEEQYDIMHKMGAARIEGERIALGDVSALLGGLLMFLGRVFDVSYPLLVRLGRLGNLLTYAIVGFFAIKRLKSGKMILAVLLLGVTNLFMASSFSYDTFVTVCTALSFSYFFAEWQEREKKIEWKNVLIMVGAMGIGVLPKAIYIVMMPILLCLPDDKFRTKKERNSYRALVIAVMLAVLATFIWPFLADMGTKSDMRGGSDVNAAEQVKFILTNPVEYTKILLDFIGYYISVPQSLGYFNNMAYIGYAKYWEVYLLILMSVMLTDKNNYDSGLMGKKGLRTFAYLILFATIVLFSTSLYVSFTPVGHNTILGCQPRYILPILFPALYLLGSAKVKNEMNRGWYNFIVFTGVAFVVFTGIFTNVIGLLV